MSTPTYLRDVLLDAPERPPTTDHLLLHPTTPSLEALIDLAICVNSHLSERCAARRTRETTYNWPSPTPCPRTPPPTLDLNPYKLDEPIYTQQRNHWPTLFVLCWVWSLYQRLSGKRQHPSGKEGVLTGITIDSSPSPTHSTLVATVSWRRGGHQIQLLINSGADASFICPILVCLLGVPTSSLKQALHTNGLTGACLTEVDTITAPVDLLIFGNHQEEIAFYIIKFPHISMVFGRPWLLWHNTQLDWV